MLQLKNISKQYKTGELVQIALNNVSLNFRDNEFVSILGPSGSGKTTLLNIVGGLDRYDSGDLIINNISTKKYKDRDWDSYRNHTIGFVFQSYNLIPHQTVLSNVELALTIGGISKKERKKRALEALEKVGLKEQAHKRPNQMSGGQMQRVAIARALVNNPDILLADEPTGALDTETSIHIMELLKQVANDRLVIMVTHNPELANEYSTRIVKLKDGNIIGDTNPFFPEKKKKEQPRHKNLGKTSMSMLTAFALSLNNLLTKKGRTILTSFAGSIGIIGIALILSLSTGFQNYINKIQEDTLTSYPLTITAETADTASMLLSMVEKNNDEAEETDKVKETQNITNMFTKVGTNDLGAFKKYMEENQSKVDEMVSFVQYLYNVKPLIYKKNKEDKLVQLNPSKLMSNFRMTSNSVLSTSSASVFNEMIEDKDILNSQYDVLAGRIPEKYDEVMLILPEANSISELLIYSLGLRNGDELEDMLLKVMEGEAVENKNEPLEFTYDELMNLQLKVLDATDTYRYNDKYNVYESMTEDEAYMKNIYDNGLSLKIVGIVCPKNDSNSMNMMPGIGYTKDLTRYVIDKASNSEIVKKQLENKDIDVFSNKRFDDDSKESALKFQDLVSIDKNAIASAFGGKIGKNDIEEMTKGYMKEISNSITADSTKANFDFRNTLSTLTKNLLNQYIDKNQVAGIATIGLGEVDTIVNDFMQRDSSKQLLSNLEKQYIIPQQTFSEMYTQLISGFLKQYIAMMNVGNNSQMQNSENVELAGGANANGGANAEIPQAEGESTDPISTEGTAVDSQEGGNEAGIGSGTNAGLNNASGVSDNTNNNNGGNSTSGTGIDFNNTSGAGLEENLSQMISSQLSSSGKAFLTKSAVDKMVDAFVNQEAIVKTAETIATKMTEATMQKEILSKVGELTGRLIKEMASAMNVDQSKIASAFKINLTEDEIKRLVETMYTSTAAKSAIANLTTLGYQEIEEPSSISLYFNDFDSKERFKNFLDDYNDKMQNEDEEKVIKYTDITGVLMSSVKVIVDSVSYVLIAFVSISLIVSSIMIGIITYISVLERTKEIGILRAIGASKRNISSIFNAETFIVGLFAGLVGIFTSLILLIPINKVIHSVTGNPNITAVLPLKGGITLLILSVILTLIGGLIPSKQATKKDPVLALRNE